MKRNITILFALLSVSFAFGQGKYGKYLNSKKLALTYKSVKPAEKDDYYQQYYWLVKAEQLKTFPHLAEVKPAVLYNFVKNHCISCEILLLHYQTIRHHRLKSLTTLHL